MRRRIVLLTTLSSLLCLAIFAVPLAIGASYYFHSRARSELERIAYAVAGASADNLDSGSRLPGAVDRGRGLSVGLYADNGRLVSGAGDAAAAAIVARALLGDQASASTDQSLYVAVPLIADDRVTGVVVARRPQAPVRHEIELVWSALLLLAAASVAGSWILARKLAAGLAGPVERLSTAVQQLGSAEIGARLPDVGIPEIDSANRSLERTSARLLSSLQRERAFSRHASHQLRTPLTGLRLLLERLAQSPGADEPELRSALQTVERLDSTITDMLQLVRGPQLEAEPLGIAELLIHVQQRWDSSFGGTGRAFVIQSAADLPPVTFPPSAARQILNVLIDNSGTHGSGTVTVTVREALGSVAIDVAQQGPPQTLPAQVLFEDRAGAGTGIGLPLARAIAQAADARLILSSVDPPTFTLLISGSAHPAAEPAQA